MRSFQLILSPIRDWNINFNDDEVAGILFQLILSPIRDWNEMAEYVANLASLVPINLKPY